MLVNLRAVLARVVDIVLLRAGPETLPASTGLLAIVVAVNVAVSALVTTFMPTAPQSWPLQLVVGTVVTLVWFKLAFVLANKRERFQQTATAIFATTTLFLPALIPMVTALLPYLGKRFGMWPSDAVKEAQALSVVGFFAASVHPAHAHIGRPERYTDDKSAFAGIQAMGKKTFHDYLKQIDGMYAGREWLSDKYSVLDPYAFVFYVWGVRRELPVAELRNYTAFRDRMMKRQAVQRVVADENVKV